MPLTQIWSRWQTVWQLPQCSGSVRKLTQDTLLLFTQLFTGQALAPFPAWEHTPLLHFRPSAHMKACPQPPQLSGLDLVSTHWPLQEVRPGRQSHVPALQYCCLLHWVWQVPQCRGSLSRSKQVEPPLGGCPAQRVAPPAHWQTPLTQAESKVALHWFPQPPQDVKLVLGSTHCPLHKIWPGMMHAQAPETHWVPVPHKCPQLPQFAASALTSTHWVPQSTLPAGQPHWPLTQTWPAPPQFVSVRQATQALDVRSQ